MEWMNTGKHAVITGGANGIGLAAARRYLEKGMNVMLADKDEDALGAALDQLGELGEVAGAICDVSDYEQVQRLQEKATETFGPVHCLMNNAGAGMPPALPWEELARWKAQIDVNQWGIVHGCHAFIPAMLASSEAAAVINTGSKQGITNPPGGYAYNMSKAGVISYTQSLAHALREQEDCQITAHLLVPGFTYSNMIARFIPEKPPGAWTSEETVDYMLSALQNGDFYIICPDNDTPAELDAKRMRWHMDEFVENRPALSRWHKDYTDQFQTYMDSK